MKFITPLSVTLAKNNIDLNKNIVVNINFKPLAIDLQEVTVSGQKAS